MIMKTNQLLRRPARMAASLTAFVLTFMLAVLPMGKVYAKNYDWQSEYIRADIQGVKIGNLYYDLNTKTHKAAVVFESHPWSGPELGIYNYKNLTSVDVPATVKFQIPLQEEITYDVVEIGTWAFHHVSVDEKFTHLSLPSSIVYIGRNMLYSNSNYIVKWWKHGGYFENYLIERLGAVCVGLLCRGRYTADSKQHYSRCHHQTNLFPRRQYHTQRGYILLGLR